MKTDRAKQILAAAAKLPPAKGRALVAALAAAAAPVPDREELLGLIAEAHGLAIEEAMLAEFQKTQP